MTTRPLGAQPAPLAAAQLISKTDLNFANEELKVDATPTFFINGKMSKGAISFEEFETKLKLLLKE